MIVVYAGPTISHAEINRHLDCNCRPPVSHGDILKLLPEMPQAIGIIDGYFEGAPSVWHKEILYAMDQGVQVYGSSSMGALRAAELYPFGMIGIGQIFDWYRDETVTDDDEVAVMHGPEEVGFLAASEPMVNIRATLELAEAHQVIDEVVKNALLARAKRTFYKERNWPTLLDSAAELFADASKRQILSSWLQQNRVNLKKADAVQMLEAMRHNRTEHSIKPRADYHFEWTQVWDVAFYEHTRSNAGDKLPAANDQLVLDQLRLIPDSYQRYRDKALLGWTGDNRVDIPTNDKALQAALKQFRADNHLDTRARLLDYMKQAGLDEAGLTTVLQRASRVDYIREAAGDLRSEIVDQLKLDGQYINLLEVAGRKQTALQSAELDSDLVPPMLLGWYFGRQPGGSIPKRLDHYLLKIDIDSTEEFYRLIKKEYLYWRSIDQSKSVEPDN